VRRRAARVIDIRDEPFDTRRPGWREAAQSFMRFDRNDAIRTRKSTQVANRTVVAEDRQGRILVITTEGAYTLWELAGLLKEWPLQLTHAMSMDGGLEASMCVVTDELRYASFGRWPDEDETPESSHVRLPAVITVQAK